jgi:D-sedoheptulose 7-phosphate isomerase
MANDIGLDVMRKTGPDKPFRVLALTDSVSLLTAVANDDGYENVFASQLKVHFKPGDKLIVISASGNSPNLVKAAQWVKENKGRVIGLLGFDGGSLRNICDTVVSVDTPKGEYGPVEDIHLILDHLVAVWLQLKGRGSGGPEIK